MEDEDFVESLYERDEEDTEDSEDDIEDIQMEDDEFMDRLEQLLHDAEITDDYDARTWWDEVEREKIYTTEYLRERVEQRLAEEGIDLYDEEEE